MPVLTLTEISQAVGGEPCGGEAELSFSDYHFDSRLIGESTLFFALREGSNDGHDFVSQVTRKPGCGAVVSRSWDDPGLGLPLIRVDDTKEAYTRLATYVRRRHQETRYVGITGSAGKTTTKELAYQILSRRYRAFRSPGNWNNWQGLPFALLKMPAETEVAIFELAMSAPGIGEIGALTRLLRPDIAVMLNVYPVHLEFLGTLDNIARAKLEILEGLGADGLALLNGDSDHIWRATRERGGRTTHFGRRRDRNRAVLQETSREGEGSRLVIDLLGRQWQLRTNLINEVHLENLFAAILIAEEAGMKLDEIDSAIDDLQPMPGRGTVTRVKGVTLIDDTYNANPEAMTRVLRWVAHSFPGRRIAVLGDMLELGEEEDEYHLQVGRSMAPWGFDLLVTAGERARLIADGAREAGFPESSIRRLADTGEAGDYLCGEIEAGTVMLFKASRGVHLDRAFDQVRRAAEAS